jgi:hypothetical protein
MKNLYKFLGLIAIGAVITLASCATTATPRDGGRYDYSSPESEDCTLYIGALAVTEVSEFDGQKVSWKGGGGSNIFFIYSPNPAFAIRVPAGTHTLTGGLKNVESDEFVYVTSTKFDFEAGKSYNVSLVSRNFRIEERLTAD